MYIMALVSATSRTEVMAISLIPLLLFPQLLFGGFVKLYGYMQQTWVQYISDLMPIRWAFEALAITEYGALNESNEHTLSLGAIIGFTNTDALFPVFILTTFLILTFLLCFLKLYSSRQ